jgi:ribosomal protein S18 acetylase RimI-like enzyme
MSGTLHALTPILFRDDVRPGDSQAVRAVVASTGFFSPEEIDVAAELVEDRLARGSQSAYFFVFAEQDDRVVGYTCYGPIACTVGSFDMYWIAVHEDHRACGIGQRLLRATEERIARAGGRAIYVETASRSQYEPTRRFYERNGYVHEATLKDFYIPGDDKVIYSKPV